MKKILILPAFNEEKYIATLVRDAQAFVDQIIVVDDGSIDTTSQKAKAAGAIVLRHSINLGKSAALQTGVEAALALNAAIIIFMDSDGQHDPKDIPRFISPLVEGKTDVVIGKRTTGDRVPLVRECGHYIIKGLIRLLFGLRIEDIISGYRAFGAEHYDALHWQAKNYNVDVEMTLRAYKNGLKQIEIPIKTVYNEAYKGMTILDGINLLGHLIVWRFTL